MPPLIFHVDLDAFFASVEQLDHPELRGKPVVVGADPGGRGVVSTCSYEARAHGIHSAMPISEAYRLCPRAVFLPVRMERYVELSQNVMTVFEEFSPDVQKISIDEAFLDMTGTDRLWGPPLSAAKRIKSRVRDITGLGISIGIAANRYVAKIASGLRKPDGLVWVEPGEEAGFMLALPLGKLWGAGEKTQERFAELGICTTAQLQGMSERALGSLFGKAGGKFLYEAVRGRDMGMMRHEAESKSISAERTFECDVSDRGILEDLLIYLADELTYRLWTENLISRRIALKLRLHNFTTITRRHTRSVPYLTADSVFTDAFSLLDEAWDGTSAVRLLGLCFAGLEPCDSECQQDLFEDTDSRQKKVEEAIFKIEHSGRGSFSRARLLRGTISPLKRSRPSSKQDDQ